MFLNHAKQYTCFALIALVMLCSCSTMRNGKDVEITLALNLDEQKGWVPELPSTFLNITKNMIMMRLEGIGAKDLKVEIHNDKNEINLKFRSNWSMDQLTSLLTMPGKFELLETFSNEEFFPVLQQLNDTIAYTNAPDKKLFRTKEVTPVATSDTGSLSQYIKEKPAGSDPEKEFMDKNPLFAVVCPSIDANNQLLNSPAVGRLLRKDSAKFNRMIATDAAKAVLSNLAAIRYGAPPGDSILNIYAVKLPQNEESAFGNNLINEAKLDFNASKEPVVYIEMTKLGTVKWARMTEKNINRFIALAIDGFVISCPRVLGKITGGATEIAGDYTVESAKALASLINSGPLPAPVKVVSTSTKN